MKKQFTAVLIALAVVAGTVGTAHLVQGMHLLNADAFGAFHPAAYIRQLAYSVISRSASVTPSRPTSSVPSRSLYVPSSRYTTQAGGRISPTKKPLPPPPDWDRQGKNAPFDTSFNYSYSTSSRSPSGYSLPYRISTGYSFVPTSGGGINLKPYRISSGYSSRSTSGYSSGYTSSYAPRPYYVTSYVTSYITKTTRTRVSSRVPSRVSTTIVSRVPSYVTRNRVTSRVVSQVSSTLTSSLASRVTGYKTRVKKLKTRTKVKILVQPKFKVPTPRYY